MRTPLLPSHRRPAAPSAPRARSGFTVVEAIVAIVMLAAGVLALVSSSVVVLNEMTVGSQNAIAASVAAQRLELLRSYNSCALMVAGADTNRGMAESWEVTPVNAIGGQPSRTIQYTLTYKAGRTTRDQKFTTNVPCN
jgi:Tfp pilus assembly protein PilV